MLICSIVLSVIVDTKILEAEHESKANAEDIAEIVASETERVNTDIIDGTTDIESTGETDSVFVCMEDSKEDFPDMISVSDNEVRNISSRDDDELDNEQIMNK